ncbi:MAG: hypothetical protein ACRDNK_21115 [Solirubrobacteraceae bacterium]
MRRSVAVVALVLSLAGAVSAEDLLRPPAAQAGIAGTACKVLGTIGEGWWGKACNGVLGVGGKLVGGGKKVAGVIGKVAGNPLVQRGVGIAAIVGWVLGGAKWTMDHMASVISSTTSPSLTAGWFTGVYLRVEAIALFFTLLFLCAAAAEALLRSDAALLARAVFAYLPLAALVTAVATPLTMLLLAASDQLSTGLASIAGAGATQFLTGTSAWVLAGLTAADPFFAVMAGGLVVAAGGALWVEMLLREIAVYVVVAMLPVVFAAMVWPARRVWAVRAVEVLVALILAKVAIVVVLALGGAALAHAGVSGISKLLAGLALILLGAFSPWLLLRLIPFAEVGAAAVGHIRGHVHASAGVRTPEAALAGRAAGKLSGDHRNGAGRNGDLGGAMAGGVAVTELLEQMQRRARAAQRAPEPVTGQAARPSPSAAGGSSLNGDRDQAPPVSGQRSHATPAATADFSARQHGGQEQIMERPDGGWEPQRQAEPDAPVAPPPWEQPDQSQLEPADGQALSAPPPDPLDDRLGGNGSGSGGGAR